MPVVQLVLASIIFALFLVPLPTMAATTITIHLPSPAHTAAGRFVLHFDGLKLPPGASGIVRVFADLPDADLSTPTNDPHYLGYFTILPKTSREAAQGVERPRASLDITSKRTFLADKTRLTITLVAMNGRSAVRAVSDDSPQVARAYLTAHAQ